MKRTGRQMKRSGRQASREPDHKHPAWETNEKNRETNEKKWETSRPGTRPDHPAPRRPFFKALRTPNSKLFGFTVRGKKKHPPLKSCTTLEMSSKLLFRSKRPVLFRVQRLPALPPSHEARESTEESRPRPLRCGSSSARRSSRKASEADVTGGVKGKLRSRWVQRCLAPKLGGWVVYRPSLWGSCHRTLESTAP